MTKLEIGALVEKMIRIRDTAGLTMYEKETLADACNLIDHNKDKLSED